MNESKERLIDDGGLTQWQIAEEVGVNHVTMSVWLRTPLTSEQAERVNEAIENLKRDKVVNQ